LCGAFVEGRYSGGEDSFVALDELDIVDVAYSLIGFEAEFGFVLRWVGEVGGSVSMEICAMPMERRIDSLRYRCCDG
jgi:hypothetical protein